MSAAIATPSSLLPETGIQRLPWNDFLENFDWRQGEHVTIVGPTGLGKTTLALAIMPRRAWTCVIACKPRDPLISNLRREGWHISREWPPASHHNRVVFWPKIERVDDVVEQREAIRECMREIYRSGGWAVFMDELAYVVKFLGLGPYCELLWQQGRSLNVSLIGSTQRPKFVPLAAYDQATHLFLFRDSDAVNLKRLGEISGVNSRAVKEVVSRLPKHDVLYVNTRDGELYVTRAPKYGRGNT